MKKIIIILVSLINATCIYTQGNNSKIEGEIRNLEKKENIAMLDHDTILLRKLWAQDFTVNTPFNRITTSGRELIDMVNKGTIRFSSFTRHIEQVVIKNGIAITMGSEEVVFSGDTPNAGQTVKRRYTNIWMKQKDVWKLTARHANNICID